MKGVKGCRCGAAAQASLPHLQAYEPSSGEAASQPCIPPWSFRTPHLNDVILNGRAIGKRSSPAGSSGTRRAVQHEAVRSQRRDTLPKPWGFTMSIAVPLFSVSGPVAQVAASMGSSQPVSRFQAHTAAPAAAPGCLQCHLP